VGSGGKGSKISTGSPTQIVQAIADKAKTIAANRLVNAHLIFAEPDII
jgi:hypothetical protein